MFEFQGKHEIAVLSERDEAWEEARDNEHGLYNNGS